MKFPRPLIRGRLIRRYKRFLSDIELDTGEVVTAHCANPGAMTGLNAPGLEVWVDRTDNPKRKLPYSWELARVEGHLVGINTSRPNALVAEALAAGRIAEAESYETIRREVKYGTGSRIDFLLSSPGRDDFYLEIKNVHLKRGQTAGFPDCVTDRGARHMRELAAMAENGARAAVLYVVQHPGCAHFEVAEDIDPAYGAAFRDALAQGVETLCYDCNIQLEGIELDKRIPIRL